MLLDIVLIRSGSKANPDTRLTLVHFPPFRSPKYVDFALAIRDRRSKSFPSLFPSLFLPVRAIQGKRYANGVFQRVARFTSERFNTGADGDFPTKINSTPRVGFIPRPFVRFRSSSYVVGRVCHSVLDVDGHETRIIKSNRFVVRIFYEFRCFLFIFYKLHGPKVSGAIFDILDDYIIWTNEKRIF